MLPSETNEKVSTSKYIGLMPFKKFPMGALRVLLWQMV